MDENTKKITVGKAAAIVISSSFLITVLVVGVFIASDKKRDLNINEKAANTIAIAVPTTKAYKKVSKTQAAAHNNTPTMSFNTVKDIFEGKTKIPDIISQILNLQQNNNAHSNNLDSQSTDNYSGNSVPDSSEIKFSEEESGQNNETQAPESTAAPTAEPTSITETASEPIAVTSTPIATTQPTAAPKLGDANGDNMVNDIDYSIWISNYQKTGTCGPSCGDFNNDGAVDSLDYIVWVNHFNG